MPPEDSMLPVFLTRKMLEFEYGAQVRLWIEAQAKSGVTLDIYGFTKEGPFRFRHTVPSDGTFNDAAFNLPDFPIFVGVTADPNLVEQGEIWVMIHIQMRGDLAGELCSGYVYSGKNLSWPAQLQNDYRLGGGQLVSLTGTNPAANTEILESVTNYEVWRLMGIQFTLVTDANAANRQVNLIIDDGTNTLLTIPAPAVQTASTTVIYNYGVALPFNNNATALVQTAPLPDKLLLKLLYRIRTSTTNRQVTDNYGAPQLYYEKWWITL